MLVQFQYQNVTSLQNTFLNMNIFKSISDKREKKISKDALVNYLKNVEGQISDNEMLKLFDLAKEIKHEEIIVEIGSYRGKSALCLAWGAYFGSKNYIYTVDPHLPFTGVNGGKFGPADLRKKYENIVKYYSGDNIFVVALSSGQFARGFSLSNQKIGLLWVDGDHSYEGVKLDYESFVPYLSKTGTVAFHDNKSPGVKRLLEELTSSGKAVLIDTCDNISVIKLPI